MCAVRCAEALHVAQCVPLNEDQHTLHYFDLFSTKNLLKNEFFFYLTNLTIFWSVIPMITGISSMNVQIQKNCIYLHLFILYENNWLSSGKSCSEKERKILLKQFRLLDRIRQTCICSKYCAFTQLLPSIFVPSLGGSSTCVK